MMWKSSPLSLRSLVAAALALLSGLAVAAAVATTEQTATREARKAATDGVASLAALLRDRLDRAVFERYRDIYIASTLALDRPGMEGDWRRVVDRLRATYPDYVWIGLVAADGRIIAASGGHLEGTDASGRTWFQEGLRGRYVGDIHDPDALAEVAAGDSVTQRLLDIASPVHDGTGTVIGVLGAHLNWGWLEAILAPRSPSLESAVEVFLVSGGRRVLAATESYDLDTLNAERGGLALASDAEEMEFWAEGGRYIVGMSLSEGYRLFPGLGWRVIVRKPVGTAFASVDELRRELIGVGAAITLGFVVAGWLVATLITRRLRAISRAADRIRAGEADVVLPSPGRFAEAASLTLSLRALVDELTHREATIRARGVEIERRQRFLTAILTSMQDALLVAQDGTVVFANESCATLFGVPDGSALTGRHALGLFRSGDAPVIDERLRGAHLAPGVAPALELEILRPDGKSAAVELRAARFVDETGLATLVMLRDITQRRQTERQLQRALRLEAVGQLTGGMAHDFNNLLSVILGNLELLEEHLADDPDALELAEAAMQASLRGGELTRQLLAFSRRQPLEPKVFDLNDLVRETAQLLRRTLGARILVRLTLTDGLWPLVADPAQLESALINLGINARDAMPKGGTLTIETANRRIGARDTAEAGDLAPGDYVMLSVSDTGMGMTPEILDRAFEPFFTTKPEGEGTGLGLAMIWGFAKQSRGHARLQSEPGRGTTVQLLFPRAVTQERSAEDGGEDLAGSPVEGMTVLVVDDNAPLRDATTRILSRLGYRVLDAGNASDALAILGTSRPVELLFTDLEMPGGMSGEQLAIEARRLRPELKVLFTTGSAGGGALAELRGRTAGADRLLEKPYRRDDLARSVAEMLRA